MDNIFQIGGQVSGDSFIGRKDFVNNIRRNFIDNGMRTSKSIVGLTRMGKSSAIKNSLSDVPSDVIYIYEDLNEWSSYNEIWQDICFEIKENLDRADTPYDSIKEIFCDMENGELPWIKMSRNVKKIFGYLSEQSIKTILVLDEFDNAAIIFTEGTKHFELFRTIFSDGKYNVFAITISRRNLYMIEGATYQSSTFHGVMDIVPFTGFNETDMKEYFDVFLNYGIELDDNQKDKIIYYSGNAPYLLSILGHYIVETYKSGEEIDIDRIFLDKCKSINDYYRDCIKHLERDDDLKRIVPFIIGPNVGVSQNDKDELFNLGYFREEDGKLIAISEYFMAFLSANMLQVDIWDNIITLEKKIKLIIENEFARVVDHYKVGGESLVAIQRNVLGKVKGITNGDISRYDSFISNNIKVFGIQSSYLDVMSLTDSFKILKDCWSDIFAKYFNSELFTSWNYKFDKCSKARNPIAHGHEEYLTDLDKNEVDTYCKQMFDMFASSDAFNEAPSNSEEVIKTAAKYASSAPIVSEIIYENPTTSLIGGKVDFVVLKRGGAKRNNLGGVVSGKYKGTIPKNYLEGLDLDDMIGTTVKVTVSRIDGDHYLLEYESSSPVVADKQATSKDYSIGDLITSTISAPK